MFLAFCEWSEIEDCEKGSVDIKVLSCGKLGSLRYEQCKDSIAVMEQV